MKYSYMLLPPCCNLKDVYIIVVLHAQFYSDFLNMMEPVFSAEQPKESEAEADDDDPAADDGSRSVLSLFTRYDVLQVWCNKCVLDLVLYVFPLTLFCKMSCCATCSYGYLHVCFSQQRDTLLTLHFFHCYRLQLQRVVGSTRANRMLQSSKATYLFA